MPSKGSPPIPTYKTAEQYRKAKLRILKRDFLIFPTTEELKRLDEVETEYDINSVIRWIIGRHWQKK